MKKGFTLIELLVVVAIVGTLSTVVLASLSSTREKANLSRARAESHAFFIALELYLNDHGGDYPADASRNIPPGIEPYLSGSGSWPLGPWPNSVYDWDNWDDPDHPGKKIYQISIRFCPSGGPLSACTFPPEPWAQNFDVDSAVYYCVSGYCRAHQSHPVTYPGYCLNCGVQPSG